MSQLQEATERHRFDSDRLADYLAAHLPGFAGPLTVKQFQGGQSDEIEVSTLASEAKEFTTGLADNGTFTMTGPSPAALPDMMQKAVARMDSIYTDALAEGVLRTDTYLVLEKPVEKEDLPEETAGDEALPIETDGSTTTETPAAGIQSFTVQYNSPDVDSVSATERAVAGVAGVQSASTTSLALGGMSVMRVTFRGDLAALKAALAARGFNVQEGGGQLRISR